MYAKAVATAPSANTPTITGRDMWPTRIIRFATTNRTAPSRKAVRPPHRPGDCMIIGVTS
ncbi:Uncharacterised protein [Mycobacteroides abscessus subsp. abscessus]|nr:Uncharacterised protein [Mycobacteroides abscessus subsp. abscessus]